jgi:thioredoxin 2
MAGTELILCSSCGAKNRVPLDKLRRALQPICGRCKTPLSAGAKPVTITDANFTAEVDRSPLPLLLDLWAPWCGPCRTMAPVIEELAQELAGHIRVAKLNVDENPSTAARFGVQSIPTLLLLKGGKEVDRLVGVRTKAELARRLAQAAAEIK